MPKRSSNPTAPAEIAAQWIPFLRSPSQADEAATADAMSRYRLPEEEPDLTRQAILWIVRADPESDIFTDATTEAKAVVSRLAAGPLEDRLGYHGATFIERIEAEAQRDRRMAWALAGVWQFPMPDDLFERVRRAADDSGWM